MPAEKEIKTYRIRFFGSSQAEGVPVKAILTFFDEQEKIGSIQFYLPDDVLGMQDGFDRAKRPKGHMSITEIGPVIDMLRYEKPVFLHWIESKRQIMLATGTEPVGEGEEGN